MFRNFKEVRNGHLFGKVCCIPKIQYFRAQIYHDSIILFQELNRLRRAGLCYSFHQLLYHVADLLEKEARNSSNEIARQLVNAASEMRMAPKRDLGRNIGPTDGSAK